MSTKIVKKDNSDAMITIGSGPISMDGLTPEQQNRIRMLAAEKGIDLAADAAQKKLLLEAATAEVTTVMNAAKGLVDMGARVSITSNSQTATGDISIKVKKGLIF